MSKKVLINILNALKEQHWLILPSALELMLDIANRDNYEQHIQALQVRDGEPLVNSARATQRGNTAILPVSGPIFPKANLFTEVSGATSLEMLSRDFTSALENPEITSIILDIDSPGGSVTGLSEMSDLIFNARGEKPIIAFVSGTGASAAFFIASAADKVIIAPEAMVGAIGTILNVIDTSARDKKEGIRELRFTSAVSPKKNLPITSKEGQDQIQAIVDRLGEIFVNAVARNRGVSNETVINDFGKGGVLIGQDAVDVGMVDAVSSFEKVLEELNNISDTSNNFQSPANLNSGGKIMDPKEIAKLTISDLTEHNPDLVNSIKDSVDVDAAKAKGHEEGVKAERERIQGIESLKNESNAKVIDSLKFDPNMDKGQAAIKVVETLNAGNASTAKDLLADGEELNKAASDLESPENSEQTTQEEHKTRVNNIAAAGSASRPVNHRSLDKVNLNK
ncbi:MAG: S49 family peptidase [Salinimicrobium sediminis]|nr:S49 family peptidase [Salinimicrobium sediminis]